MIKWKSQEFQNYIYIHKNAKESFHQFMAIKKEFFEQLIITMHLSGPLRQHCVCVGVSPPVCLCLRKSYSTVTDSTSETPLAYLQQDRAQRKAKLQQLYIHAIKEVPH